MGVVMMIYILLDDEQTETFETDGEALEGAIEFDDYDDTYSIRSTVCCIIEYDPENEISTVIYTYGSIESIAEDKTQNLKDDKQHDQIERENVHG